MNENSSPSTAVAKPRRAAFTLVELLVVIGIIALLVGFLLPALFRSKKAGYIAAAQQNIQAIAMAVEAYQQAWRAYPPYTGTAPYNTGSASLNFTLMSPHGRMKGGVSIGEPYGPFLDRDKFNLNNNELNDSDGNPILYFPARNPIPDITTGANFVADSATALYDHRTGSNISLFDMRLILGDGVQHFPTAPPTPGDRAPNGIIDATDKPSYTGPFILWGTGPDGKYGLNAKGKTDDVTNFEIPSQFR